MCIKKILYRECKGRNLNIYQAWIFTKHSDIQKTEQTCHKEIKLIFF